MSGLSPSARQVLDAWIAACSNDPSRLPGGVRIVQARLVRIVGCGELPGEGSAYLKLMSFPRGKDRVRYAIRALPAAHEASVLAFARRAVPDVPVPEVLAATGSRRYGLPRMSLLVTRALPLLDDGARATLAEGAEIAVRIARTGLFHPDLHLRNLPRLADGRLALIDLQSARIRGEALGPRDRFAMARKLAAEAVDGDLAPLAAAGLVPAGEIEAVRAAAHRLRVAELDRRIRRCWSTSTEFERRRGPFGAVYRRRKAGELRLAGEGGRELRRLWLGDRACEILDGAVPVFAMLTASPRWLGGRHRLYIPATSDVNVADRRQTELLDGHRRWRRLRVSPGSCAIADPTRAAGSTVGAS